MEMQTIRKPMATGIVAMAFAAVLSMRASAAKKYIFAGWDISDVTPAEILAHADNAAGSDPIGGVGSGGVVELCLTFPLFHHPTLPLFHSSTHIATGKMPVFQSHTACR